MVVSCSFTFGEANYNSLPCCSKTNHERSTRLSSYSYFTGPANSYAEIQEHKLKREASAKINLQIEAQRTEEGRRRKAEKATQNLPNAIKRGDIKTVQALTSHYLIYCTIYIALAFPAFQLDGIFIGSIQSQAMRNTAILSSITLFLAGSYLTQDYGNTGLWISFIIFVCIRAVLLGIYYPRVTSLVK